MPSYYLDLLETLAISSIFCQRFRICRNLDDRSDDCRMLCAHFFGDAVEVDLHKEQFDEKLPVNQLNCNPTRRYLPSESIGFVAKRVQQCCCDNQRGRL